MFVVEILAFLLVFPIAWWLGGRLGRGPEAPAPRPPNVVDLEVWRRRRARESEAKVVRLRR